MNSFFQDLKSQSRGTREVLFGLCVVITVSLAGTIWFRSFEERIFVGLNPDAEMQAEFHAERRSTEQASMLAGIGTIWGSMKATIADALGIVMPDAEMEVQNGISGSPHPLPISEDK